MKYNKGTFILIPNKQFLVGKKPIVQCVYMRLCEFEKDGLCFPSVKTIASNSGCSDRAVREAIKVLIEIGILKKAHNIRNNAFTSNTYHVIIKEKEVEPDAGGTESDAVPYAGGAGGTEGGADRINPKELSQTNPPSSKEEEQSSPKPYTPKNISLSINQIIDRLQVKMKAYNIIYSDEDERHFAKHMTSKKRQGVAKKYGYDDPIEFAEFIVDCSMQCWWKYKIDSLKSIYQKYSKVMNSYQSEAGDSNVAVL